MSFLTHALLDGLGEKPRRSFLAHMLLDDLEAAPSEEPRMPPITSPPLDERLASVEASLQRLENFAGTKPPSATARKACWVLAGILTLAIVLFLVAIGHAAEAPVASGAQEASPSPQTMRLAAMCEREQQRIGRLHDACRTALRRVVDAPPRAMLEGDFEIYTKCWQTANASRAAVCR